MTLLTPDVAQDALNSFEGHLKKAVKHLADRKIKPRQSVQKIYNHKWKLPELFYSNTLNSLLTLGYQRELVYVYKVFFGRNTEIK